MTRYGTCFWMWVASLIYLRCEIADFCNGCGVKFLEHCDKELNHLVEVAAIHDAVMGMCIANRNHHINCWDTADALLQFGGIVKRRKDASKMRTLEQSAVPRKRALL